MQQQHVNINVPLSFNQIVEIVSQLTPKEKIKLKSVLKNEIEIPEEQQKLVLDRFKKVRKDPSRLLNWDDAKKRLNA